MPIKIHRESVFDNDLAAASRDGDLEQVTSIVRGGVDPNTPNVSGARPIRLASGNNHVEIVRWLLSNGASPNVLVDGKTAGNTKGTALIAAAKRGNIEIMNLLIDSEADLNLSDVNDQTPLMWAVAASQLDAAKLLLSAGANPNLTDKGGQTALSIASDIDDAAIKSLLSS